MTTNTKKIKTKTGEVVKISGKKTIKVSVIALKKHSLYHKTLKSRKYYLVDDCDEKAKVGDTVVIVETRPLSSRKKWRLLKTVEDGQKVVVGL